MLINRAINFLLFLFLFIPLSSSFAAEQARLITQKALINDELLIKCEGLANYLNSVQKEFQFQCQYLSEEEIFKLHLRSNDVLIIKPPTFTFLKAILVKKHLSLYPLFNIFNPKFGWNGYQGAVFFTKRGSSINILSDLKDKRVGCVGEFAGCTLLLQYELYKLNIPEEKVKFVYLGNWGKVVEAVLSGKVDVGVVRTGVLEHLSKKGMLDLSQIKILNQKTYPNFPYLVSSDLIPDWCIAYSHTNNPSLIFTLLQNLYPFILKNEKIPNTELMLSLPKDPYLVLNIQKILFKGPFAYLKSEIKKRQITIALIIATISLAIISILSFLLIKLYRLNQDRKRLLTELQELNQTLELQVEEKTVNLVNALEELKRESQKFLTVFHNIDLGLCIVDKEGKIIEVNDFVSKSLGVKILKGEDLCKIIEIGENQNKALCERLKLEGHAEFETTFHREDGRELFLRVKLIPLDKTLKLVVIEDVTAQKKLFEESLRTTQLETLRVLSSGLAHDLNNFLSAIATNIELLLRKKDLPEDEKRAYLERIKSVCFRAKTLTQELLVLGKSLVLNPKAEKLPEFLKELTELILSGSGIIPVYHFDPKAVFAKVDKSYLSIALTNIILNARQAMQDRGTLYVSTKAIDEEVLIEIRDTGPGIPEEVKNRLFQPFTTTKPGGSGLGLFSAKRIVEAHGGRMEIGSEKGKGTAVKIYLHALSPEEVHLEEKSVISQEKEEDLGETKRVLLMDDEAEVRESLAELLSELGYEVIACENGEEAVKIYQEQGPFDIAILDYTVPGKWNGIEVLRELKKVHPEVKAILATGYGQTETVVLAKQEGFKEVLVKPFEVEELLRALKASLS